jgi:FAD/FMN-containing dehydrogenase
MSNGTTRIDNFGGNVSFTPARFYAPRSEAEVVEILARHRGERIRCIGSLHSWSRVAVTSGVSLDLRHLDAVAITSLGPDARVHVGAGCTLARLVAELRAVGLALPTLGAIFRQTVAGATSTGTHGSGSHSLSHFIEEVRVATFDPLSRQPAVITIKGDELPGARCALGSLGVIVEVVMRAAPAWQVEERLERCSTLDEILREQAQWPLQQFVFLPWSWRFLVYRRKRAAHRGSRLRALLCRAIVFLFSDLGLHLLLKLNLKLLSDAGIRGFYRKVLPWFPLTPERTDDSAAVLTLRHDLFRHVEMELFVPESRLAGALDTVRKLLELAAGERAAVGAQIHAILGEEVNTLRGTWTHHYPLLCRRILADETLVSMASAGAPPEPAWFSISFFTFLPFDERYARFCKAMARCLERLHGARQHWGKYFPLPFALASASYPRFRDYRELCLKYDPEGVFWNEAF